MMGSMTRVRWQHATSVSVAVLIAATLNFYFSYSGEGWAVIAALFVSQTTRGTPFKQGMYFTFLLFCAMAAAALCREFIASAYLMQCLAIILFVLAAMMMHYYRPMQNVTFFLLLIFPLIFLIAILLPQNESLLFSSRLLDALYGAAIGILCGQLIFPAKPYRDFVMGLVPVLQALADYSHKLNDYLQEQADADEMRRHQLQIQASLQVSATMYPEWVYELGFNPGLRAGFRFFLINLERITEAALAIDYIVQEGVCSHLAPALRDSMAAVSVRNATLFIALMHKLQGEDYVALENDLSSDTAVLDNVASQYLPGGLDLMGLTDDYARIASLVRDLKDVRLLVLQLLMALPDK